MTTIRIFSPWAGGSSFRRLSIVVAIAGLTMGLAPVSRANDPNEYCTNGDIEPNAEPIFRFDRIEVPPRTEDDDWQIYSGFVLNDAHLDKEYLLVSYIERSPAPIANNYKNAEILRFVDRPGGPALVQENSEFGFEEDNPIRRAAAVSFDPLVLAAPNRNVRLNNGDTFAELQFSGFFDVLHEWLFESLAEGFGVRPADLDATVSSRLIRHQNFARNVSLTVQTNVTMRGRYLSGAKVNQADGSKFTITTRHDITERPGAGFVPRKNDPRVGYFHTERDILSSLDRTTADRHVYRWRLEKKDPDAALSDPVKPITFWIENTTPIAFRPYVEAGVLAWNEAFEAAGFSNALDVKIQPDDARWGSGNIECNVIRWVASPEYEDKGSFGFGPAANDPITGEIFAADIRLSYLSVVGQLDDWRRFNRAPVSELVAGADVASQRMHTPDEKLLVDDGFAGVRVLAAMKAGAGPYAGERADGRDTDAEKVLSPLTSSSAEGREAIDVGYFDDVVNEPELADRMTAEVITNLTMHEVGHVLGLKHNFRASRWRPLDAIHDRSVTKGLIAASVMDYLPINFAPIGTPQGDFSNTRIGPYDIWVIQFGYDPTLDDSRTGDAARDFLLARAQNETSLARSEYPYARDPRGLRWDLTDQPEVYAAERLGLIDDLVTQLETAPVAESWIESSFLFDEIYTQRLQAALRIAELIEPYRLSYDSAQMRGSPIVMASRDDQDVLLKILQEHVFSAEALNLSPAFMQSVGPDVLATHPGNFPFRYSASMKAQVLSTLLNKELMIRLSNASTFGDSYSPGEYLSKLVDVIFGADLTVAGRPNAARREQQILFATQFAILMAELSSHRRDPRRSYVTALNATLSTSMRPVLSSLQRDLLLDWPWLDATTKAHREELRRILRNADF